MKFIIITKRKWNINSYKKSNKSILLLNKIDILKIN